MFWIPEGRETFWDKVFEILKKFLKFEFQTIYCKILLSRVKSNVRLAGWVVDARAAQIRKKPKKQNPNPNLTPKPKTLMSCKIFTFIHKLRPKTFTNFLPIIFLELFPQKNQF